MGGSTVCCNDWLLCCEKQRFPAGLRLAPPLVLGCSMPGKAGVQ